MGRGYNAALDAQLDKQGKNTEKSGCSPFKVSTVAQWMIATETGCCLRPLGIVMNEKR
jgi:hypothetical protein